MIPRVHVFPLQDALNIFGASGRAMCVSQATTMSPSSAVFMAVAGADDDLPEKLSTLLDESSVVPTSTSVAIVPATITTESPETSSLSHLQALETFVNVSAQSLLLRQNPNTVWDFTNSASVSDYNRKHASALFQVITSAMTGFLVQDSMTDQSFNKTLSFDNMHNEFLNGIFGSFGLPEASLKELDGLLTNTTNTLVKLNMDPEGSGTQGPLDHMIFVTYFEKMEGLDYNIPKLRLFFLHIDQASWMRVVETRKSSTSTSMINFNMNYSDVTFTMTWMPSKNEFDKVQQMMEKMCRKQVKDLNKLNNTSVIKA